MKKILIIVGSILFLTACCCCKEANIKNFNINESVSKSTNNLSYNNAIKSGKPVVLKFYIDWCGACEEVEPIFNQVKSQYSDKAEFISINGNDDQELASKYYVKAYPTIFLIYPNGSKHIEIPYQKIFYVNEFIQFLDENIDN